MLMKCLTNRWLKECVQFTIVDHIDGDGVANLAIDGSLVRLPLNLFIQILSFSFFFKFKALDPNFADSLQILDIWNVPAGK